MKKVVVISLGGSLIIPDKINFKFLDHFKKVLRKHYKNYKFVVVCGGGVIARKYISALRKEHRSNKELSFAGIRATRMNAMFMMQFFGKKEANDVLPSDMAEVKSNLRKNSVVFCGALRYADNETSDGTAAKLANYLNTDFINLTNIPGLYDKNPLTNKSARFIPEISWQDFDRMANKKKFKVGQHFVLDQNAATIIRKHRIKTYILGPKLKNLRKLLNSKSFTGTTIFG